MQSDLQAAINAVCSERGLSKNDVYKVIEDSVIAAWRKEHGEESEHKNSKVEAKFDDITGVIHIIKRQEVVTKLENENTQITLAAAKKIDPNLQAGDYIDEDITPDNFGRIATQAARQAIVQKLREAQNTVSADFFHNRIGTLAHGTVKKIDDKGMEVELERMFGYISKDKLIPGEKFRLGQSIKVYIEGIQNIKGSKKIMISRTNPNFIVKLFEEQVPEIEDGKVVVKKVAREAGIRTKIAVYTDDENIDPVGACVGKNGIRIQTITEELNTEYVDVIEWLEDKEEFLRNCLDPGEVEFVEFLDDDEPPRIICHVLEENRASIIGKNGQNVRLASKMIDYEIDIVTLNIEK